MASSKHWTTEPDREVNIKRVFSGVAAVKPKTVFECFSNTAKRFPDKPALFFKKAGEWRTYSYKKYLQEVRRAAKALIKLGVQPHSVVAVIGFNSQRLFIAYLAAIMAGGIGVSMYTTNSAESCKYIAEHSKAVVVVVENQLQRDKLLKVAPDLPELKAIIQYSDVVSQDIRNHKGLAVYTWKEFKHLGDDLPDYELHWRLDGQKPGNCAILIYTSGTTGPPKVYHDYQSLYSIILYI
jgi:long-chain-fatty-acid--CoA ligase ACSBG